MTAQCRATFAIAVFVVLWIGSWPVGYWITGDPEFLWIAPTVLVGALAWLWIVNLVLDWVYRGTEETK
jgi:hypothetical protein